MLDGLVHFITSSISQFELILAAGIAGIMFLGLVFGKNSKVSLVNAFFTSLFLFIGILAVAVFLHQTGKIGRLIVTALWVVPTAYMFSSSSGKTPSVSKMSTVQKVCLGIFGFFLLLGLGLLGYGIAESVLAGALRIDPQAVESVAIFGLFFYLTLCQWKYVQPK